MSSLFARILAQGFWPHEIRNGKHHEVTHRPVSEGFRREMLERIEQTRGQQHYGEELQESEQEKAERVVKAQLRNNRWTEEELGRRRKGDRKKAELAAALRAQTTMTWPWIAQRLAMGHWRTAANAVRKAT